MPEGATQIERTLLTIRFNQGMKQFCAQSGIEYLDLDGESLGSDGLVDLRLLNSNPLDHHYEPCAYMKMLIPRLAKHL